MPIRIGMPTKKTIVVPCIVNSWLNVSWPEDVVAREEELPAHQQRLDAADHQKHDGHQHVHDADLLVIDRGRPLVQHEPSSRRSAARSPGVPVSSRPRVGSTTDMVEADLRWTVIQRSVSK